MQTIKFAPQVCPSNQTPTNNHHLQTQFEGLPLTTNPQIGRQTLNKFDYPILLPISFLFLTYQKIILLHLYYSKNLDNSHMG